MQLTGEQTLSLPIDQVWEALNDPKTLQKCIPGCDTFEKTEENRYRIVMTATVGPIRAKFSGKLELSDIQPPVSYKLKFDGSGGAAGSGRGTADVQLSEVEEGTRLQYSVSATVAGRLAQVGTRLIDGVAKKMADHFFSEFKSVLEPEDVAPEVQTSAKDAHPGRPPAKRQARTWAIAAAVAVAAALLYLWAR